jgi:hypothetical protein
MYGGGPRAARSLKAIATRKPILRATSGHAEGSREANLASSQPTSAPANPPDASQAHVVDQSGKADAANQELNVHDTASPQRRGVPPSHQQQPSGHASSPSPKKSPRNHPQKDAADLMDVDDASIPVNMEKGYDNHGNNDNDPHSHAQVLSSPQASPRMKASSRTPLKASFSPVALGDDHGHGE